MPGQKRFRAGYRVPLGGRQRFMRMYASPSGSLSLGMTRGAQLRGLGSRSLSAAMSRVHTFKRVGEPLVLRNNSVVGNRVDAAGNTSMLGASPAYVVDPTLGANFSQIRAALRFTLGQAANISEITNLFDNYRIKQVRLRFDLSYDTNMGSFVNGAALNLGPVATPIINYCYDPDDSTTPTSRVTVMENGYCKTRRLDRSFTVSVTPRVQSVVQATASTTAGGLLPLGQWLDAQSTGIEHFGLKMVIDQFPFLAVDNIVNLTITPTFYIEAKNVV